MRRRAARVEARQREKVERIEARQREKERRELRELAKRVLRSFKAEAQRSKAKAKWALNEKQAGSVGGQQRVEVTVLAADGNTAYVGTAGGAVVALAAHSSKTSQSRTELCAGGKVISHPSIRMHTSPPSILLGILTLTLSLSHTLLTPHSSLSPVTRHLSPS